MISPGRENTHGSSHTKWRKMHVKCQVDASLGHTNGDSSALKFWGALPPPFVDVASCNGSLGRHTDELFAAAGAPSCKMTCLIV